MKNVLTIMSEIRKKENNKMNEFVISFELW